MNSSEYAQWATVIITFAIGGVAIWVQKSISARQQKLEKDIAARQEKLEKDIADRQTKLESEKIRLDLFDKRIVVWQSLRDLFRETGNEDLDSFGNTLHKFSSDVREAHWLFDPETVNYLNIVRDKAGKLRSCRKRMEYFEKHKPTGIISGKESYSEIIESESSLVQWFALQADVASFEVFFKYLSFQNMSV